MKSVTIYTRPLCSYSARALELLKKKNVDFKNINAGATPELRKEMVQRSNGSNTFPQIFIEDMHIGGCDDLMALDRAGKLDALLAS